jgi:hypothetical protein
MRFALEVPTTHSPVGWMDGGPYSQLDSPARTKLSPRMPVITARLKLISIMGTLAWLLGGGGFVLVLVCTHDAFACVLGLGP